MHEFYVAVLVLLGLFILVKMYYPNKLPDYKICRKDKCWSTKQLDRTSHDPVPGNKSQPVPDPTSNVDKVEDSQKEGLGCMYEVFTSPKYHTDTRHMLWNVADSSDMTLNYQVKYSK